MDADLTAEQKAAALAAGLRQAVRLFLERHTTLLQAFLLPLAALLQSEELGLLQRKIGEINSKSILLKQRKNAGGWLWGGQWAVASTDNVPEFSECRVGEDQCVQGQT